MAHHKLSLAAISLAALLASSSMATAATSSPAFLEVRLPEVETTALPQDPGSFFHRLQQMRQRRASYDQHTIPSPEPVTLSLLGLGGRGLAIARRRQNKLAQV